VGRDREQAKKEAIELIESALKERANIVSAYLFWGHILKVSNEVKGAEEKYKKCLELDPRNVDAAQELRLIDLRRKKPEKDKK
jgi:Tfp pilus assembly protein PilF